MKWEKSDTRYALRWLLLVSVLLVGWLLPIEAQQIQISQQQLNELNKLNAELKSHIAPLRTHNAELEKSLTERESLLQTQNEELNGLRLSTSSLQISLDQIATQLEQSQKAQIALNQSVTDLTSSSHQLRQAAQQERRRKHVWQVATAVATAAFIWQLAD